MASQRMTFRKSSLVFLVTILGSMAFANHPVPSLPRTITESRYTTAHSLGDDYAFDPRDGWQSANVTNLRYKYGRSLGTQKPEEETTPKKGKSPTLGNAISVVTGSLKKALWGLKGLGKLEDAVITWYTGEDLLNPSCWSDGKWAPTDASFACALTMEGWKDRPQCFKFLEVCHTPHKCVFVRVVDTCAGCSPGTKHIDLTKAAFGQLGKLDDGRLLVKYRPATEPDTWFEKLWGPKIHHVKGKE